MSDHVTVVLPTHRRGEALLRTLKGLSHQVDVGVPWDLVVVENDALPGSVEAATRVALRDVGVPARVVVEPVLGASSARNRGIREAGGSVIAFIDDDVVPDKRWLTELVAPIIAGRCEGVGGRVQLDPSVPLPEWIRPWLKPYLSDFHPSESEVDLTSISSDVLIEPYVLTANAAFAASALQRAGGFDPRLGTRAGTPFANEELALCRSVLDAGGRLRYVPAARVVHEVIPERLTVGFFARRLYAQGRSDWMLDRDVFTSARSGGVRRTFEFLASDIRVTGGRFRRRPAHEWLFWSAIKRSGFLRESVASLIRRVSRSSRGE